MLATSPSGQGGIASVCANYLSNGLQRRVALRFLTSHSSGGAFHKLKVALQAATTLLIELLRRRVAVVHAHSATRASFTRKSLLLLMARCFGVATIFHLHGGRFREFYAAECGPIRKWWVRRTFTQSSRVLVLSASWRDFVLSIAPHARVEVLANPVDAPASRQRQPVSGRLLFLGRASQGKGVFDLIQALAIARRQAPALHLRIGGDGDLAAVREAAELAGVASAVELLGWVLGADKEAELCGCEALVLPSYNEGLPMVVLEAMIRGVPVLATPVGGIPEIIEDGRQGLLVKPGDVSAIADGLVRLHEDHELRSQITLQAQQRVANEYLSSRVLDDLCAIYASLGVKEIKNPLGQTK